MFKNAIKVFNQLNWTKITLRVFFLENFINLLVKLAIHFFIQKRRRPLVPDLRLKIKKTKFGRMAHNFWPNKINSNLTLLFLRQLYSDFSMLSMN